MHIINPKNNCILTRQGDKLVDKYGNVFLITNGVPRIAKLENYTENFGFEWNKFDKTQLDHDEDSKHFKLDLSRNRFFSETNWDENSLVDQNILEVGSGAGRFSRVILRHTKATLFSVDYSDAVSANMKNNEHLAPDRFHLFQASIYALPFQDNSFDKVICFGVLQHTPDFEASIKALIDKAKQGSEIVVDFYPINGWWTKIHSKYIFRPITKRLSHTRLMSLIERNIAWLIWLFDFFQSIGFGFLSRFIPITDIRGFPKNLSFIERKEWAVLDTFDAFSPEFDNPQRITDVVNMFERNGAHVIFSGVVKYDGGESTVVRALKDPKVVL